MKKKKIVEDIVDFIRSKDALGRFLEFDPSSGYWNVVSYQRAVDKTSQTFREKNNKISTVKC